MKNLLKFVLFALLALFLIACNTVTEVAPEEASTETEQEEAATSDTEEETEEEMAEEEEMEESDDRADWPEVFTIGVFAGDDAEAALKGGEPLRDYLSAELGIPVEATTGTSYSAVIEAMKAGRVDAMQVGPFSFVLAEREAGAIPIATIVNESRDLAEYSADVFPYYFSVFVTKKGSGIETLTDLEGVDLAFVDPASTSGRNAPVERLISDIDGLDTPTDVDEWLTPIFAGSHPSAITALANDQVEAAVTYEGNLLTFRESGEVVCGFEEERVGIQLTQEEIDAVYADCPEGGLVVIAQSNPIPNTPFAISPDMPESFREAVREALLKTADSPEFIEEFGSWYVAPEDLLNTIDNTSDFYNVVRNIAAVTIDEEAPAPAAVDKSEWPETFTIGVFAGDDAEAALKGGEPLRDYLSEKLGIPVEATTGTSYSAVIEAMKAGRVDAMQVGPFSFVLAEREAGAIPIATIVNESRDLAEFDADVFPYYFSVFVTKKGSGIETLSDLEGVDLAFVDPASTSGRNAPVERLISDIDGLDTPGDVDEWLNPIFAGSHPSAITALANDQVEAAVTYEGNLLTFRESGEVVCGFEEERVGIQLTQEEIDAIFEECPEGGLVVIAQSNPIPNTPFAMSPDMPESFRDAVRVALLETADDPDFIQEFGSWYVAPEDLLNTINNTSDFYNVVRNIAAVTIDEEAPAPAAASGEYDKSEWPETFTIGVFAGDDAEAALKGGEPLRDYLADFLGIPVEATTGTSYSAVIEAMKAGRVDAMQVGPFSFVLAEQEAGAIPLATIVNESRDLTEYSADVFPFYFSVFVTKKGSGIETLNDLEGVDLAFVDPASTSGRNAPLERLISDIDGLETPDDVDSWLNPIFAGSHPSAITALANDQVIAAVTYEGNLLTFRESGEVVCGFEEDRVGIQLTQEEIDAIFEECPEGGLVVIAQSNPIPNTPFAISPDMPESFQQAVRDALLSTSESQEFIDEFGSWYVAPEDILDTIDNTSQFYDVVRNIAAITVEE